MKKEARNRAETLFLKSGGKAGNKEIADKIGVHPLTVGRWRKQDNWGAKLEESKPNRMRRAPAAKRPVEVRKKAKLEEALKLYVESGGQISNIALATQVGVSAATISKWKDAGQWTTRVKKPAASVPAAGAGVEHEVPVSSTRPDSAVEEIEIDMEALTFPDHITLLNKRLDEILAREYLSPEDLKTAAEAKEAILQAVGAYIGVLEFATND